MLRFLREDISILIFDYDMPWCQHLQTGFLDRGQVLRWQIVRVFSARSTPYYLGVVFAACGAGLGGNGHGDGLVLAAGE